jgi:hypothetical protein
MPDTPRNYSISNDFPGATIGVVNTTKLKAEILASSITTVLNRIDTDGDTISIVFNATLTAGEATTLDNDTTNPAGGLIAAHNSSPMLNSPHAATTDPTNNDDETQGAFVGMFWINTTTPAMFHCVDVTAGSAVWQKTGTFSTIDEGTGNITTTSTTDVATNVTRTPPAGTYLTYFSGSVENSGSNESVFTSIWAAGSQVTASERETFNNRANDASGFCSEARVTVNGSQAIEGRWRVSGNTGTMHGRTMILISTEVL